MPHWIQIDQRALWCSAFLACLVAAIAGCREPPCEVDADCDGYANAVCQDGNCVCAFDEAGRCYCDAQERCDEVYGEDARTCFDGVCVECRENADCPGSLGVCDRPTSTCYTLDCDAQTPCVVGFCDVATNDCYACQADADCAEGYICRDDGACVACVADEQCGPAELCDADFEADVGEVVGTNQCGLSCGPTCAPECDDDPDCLQRLACLVTDPGCLPAECETWDDCPSLPDGCSLRLRDCPDGRRCEAIGRSYLTPVYYACLETPCLFDFECEAEGDTCYEGRCLPACEPGTSCPNGGRCTPRVGLPGAACLTN